MIDSTIEKHCIPSIFNNVPISSKDVIPKHGILSIVGLWNAVVDIVGFGIKYFDSEEGNDNVKASVIQSGHDATRHQKQEYAQNVNLKVTDRTTQKQGPKMIVFAKKELDRMDVDGIDTGTAEKYLKLCESRCESRIFHESVVVSTLRRTQY